MTEKTWLQHQQARPLVMLMFLHDKVSERKKLLFNCACSRRVWNRLGEADHTAVIDAEQSADNPHAIEALKQKLEPEQRVKFAELRGEVILSEPVSEWIRDLLANQTSLRVGLVSGYLGIAHLAHEVLELVSQHKREPTRVLRRQMEEIGQTKLIRDIFGNPFRPVAFSPEWRTDTAVSLARQMYESREFGAMPILADALQDAGCDSDDILTHCRSEGTHVRGCWVVDLVLGKE